MKMTIFSRELWTELLYTLKRNKRRSIITSLGVFAGMFFFTVLTSLSTGLRNSAFSSLDGVNNSAIYFIPGRTTKPYQGFKANRQINTTYRDYINIQQQSHLIEKVSAITLLGVDGVWGNITVRANTKSHNVAVWGVGPNHFETVERLVAVYGRLMTREEIERGEFLCMVAKEIAGSFYGEGSEQEMLGTYITANGLSFKVIGIVEPYTDNFSLAGMGQNGIMVPLSIAVGSNYDKPLMLSGVPKPGYSEEEVKAEVFQILSRRQQIDPTDTGALISMSMGIFTHIYEMISDGINILVWIVGLGTLITGVISVSNILLVTVRERQREIGVRRAIGAKPRDIRRQFMAEAVFIILVAGLLGTLLGLLVSLGIGAMAESTKLGAFLIRPYPSLGLLLFSVSIMLVAGVLAGLLPVYKALQIKAIDAIRDE